MPDCLQIFYQTVRFLVKKYIITRTNLLYKMTFQLILKI